MVLKPDDGPCQQWLGEALSHVEMGEVRIGRPVTGRQGSWQHDGWVATEFVPGLEPSGTSTARWHGTIEAGRAFHRAVAHLPRPHCLDERRDPWTIADGAAWGESSAPHHPLFDTITSRLRDALEPLGTSQLVHGDLTGNVLFDHEVPTAVIDVSPYWRPVQYVEGVVVADALCWHDAPPSLATDLGVPVAAVARALLFRLLTTIEREAQGHISESQLQNEAHRYERAATAIGL